MATPRPAPPQEPFTAAAQLISNTAEDGHARIAFTAHGDGAPAIWSPAFGSPRPMAMQADGPKRWRLETTLPADACASWAAVRDMRAALPSISDRLRALVSTRARVDLGTRMDARFIVNNATAPSLYRLVGADPQHQLTPNIGLIPTPNATAPDTDSLCAPAPQGTQYRVGRHRLVTRGDYHNEALLLDGEVLRRWDDDLAETGWSRSYLDNRSAPQRLRDHSRPMKFAQQMAPLLRDIECTPHVIIGTSATAPTALALAIQLKATQVVLLSPAFPNELTRQYLATEAAGRGIRLDVRAGCQENGAGDPRRAILDHARAFCTQVRQAGGDATFREFSGGHDLPAWHFAQLHALREAAAQL